MMYIYIFNINQYYIILSNIAYVYALYSAQLESGESSRGLVNDKTIGLENDRSPYKFNGVDCSEKQRAKYDFCILMVPICFLASSPADLASPVTRQRWIKIQT